MSDKLKKRKKKKNYQNINKQLIFFFTTFLSVVKNIIFLVICHQHKFLTFNFVAFKKNM